METGSKICVKCGQKDFTDFSSCRFCGTRYDAVLKKLPGIKGEGLGGLLRSWPSLILILVLLSFLKGPFMKVVMYVAAGGHTLEEVARKDAGSSTGEHR